MLRMIFYEVKILRKFLTRSRIQQLLMMAFDIVAVNASYFLSLFFHNFFRLYESDIERLVVRIPYVTVVYIGLFLARKLYKNLWKYMGFYELTNTVMCAGLATAICFIIDYIFMKAGYIFGINCPPFAVYVEAFLFICMFCAGIRTFYKAYRAMRSDKKRRRGVANKRIMIIGAGDMANSVLYEMSISGYKFGSPVVIADDDDKKQKLRIRDIPVAGKIADIPRLVKEFDVNEIIYCIPSADAQRKREILEIAMSTGCNLKTAPKIVIKVIHKIVKFIL